MNNKKLKQTEQLESVFQTIGRLRQAIKQDANVYRMTALLDKIYKDTGKLDLDLYRMKRVRSFERDQEAAADCSACNEHQIHKVSTCCPNHEKASDQAYIDNGICPECNSCLMDNPDTLECNGCGATWV